MSKCTTTTSLINHFGICRIIGYYVAPAQDKAVLTTSTESIAQVIRSEMVDGCVDDDSIKCGLIGEIGCSYPLHGKHKGIK